MPARTACAAPPGRQRLGATNEQAKSSTGGWQLRHAVMLLFLIRGPTLAAPWLPVRRGHRRMRYQEVSVYCEKCRAPVDQSGRGGDGYFTCGYGGSHRAVASRPAATARITRANRRHPPRKMSPKRQVIRQQQLEDAREMGRAEREIRASAALRRHLATWRQASAKDSRESPER